MRLLTSKPAAGCVALLLAAAIAGCDARDVVGPSARTAIPRTTVNAPVGVGSIVLRPPGTSGPGDVASISPEQFASIPEPTWVVVNVSGMLTASWNSACDKQPPYWPCMDGPVTTGFGSEPWDGGPVKLWTNQELYGRSALRLRGSGGAGESSGSAVGLAYFYRPGTIDGQLNLVAQWAWDPNVGHGPASWLLGGGYTVTATAVPSPFHVTESAPDADGTVTYTAEPLYGLRFSNPLEWYWYWPAGAATWAFYPGDSLPDTPDRSWPGWQITDCQFQLVCRWKPPVAGRMQVQAYVEGQSAYVRSSQPAADPCGTTFQSAGPRFSVSGSSCGGQEPQLVLECNGQRGSVSLVRASNINCVPKTDPAGASITVTGWKFAGADYSYPGPDDGPVTDPEWTGPMVMSGTITVTAKVGSSTTDQTASVTVTVTPRTVAPEQPELVSVRMGTIDDIDPENRPHVPPLVEHDLGLIQYAPVMFGNTDSEASTFFGFVTDGPNTYLAYLTKVPARADLTVALNPQMRVGSDFYRKQAHFGQVVTPTCVQEQWQTYINRILAHEGFPVNPDSHAGYYERKVHEKAWTAVEDIVRPNNELYKMAQDWQSRLPKVFADAKTYAARVDQEHKVAFGCTFNFNP